MENEAGQPDDVASKATDGDGLLDRIGLIEAQPLDQRARGFEQVHDELLLALQRSDHEDG